MFLTAPLVGRLMSRVDARFMLGFGFAVVAISNWQMTIVTQDWDFDELLIPQILRGFGMMFAIVPITSLSLGTLQPSRLKNASGLFNLTRNLGGAVGLAGLNTVLNKRVDLHLARLHESITWSRRPAVEMLNNLAARIPTSDAQSMALKQLFLFTRQQGIVMAFADVFMLLALMFAIFAGTGLAVATPSPGHRGTQRTLVRVLINRELAGREWYNDRIPERRKSQIEMSGEYSSPKKPCMQQYAVHPGLRIHQTGIGIGHAFRLEHNSVEQALALDGRFSHRHSFHIRGRFERTLDLFDIRGRQTATVSAV